MISPKILRLVALLLLMFACSLAEPENAPSIEQAVALTLTAVPTHTASPVPTASATATITPRPVQTVTPSASPSPQPTLTPTLEPTATISVTGTITNTATPSQTPTPTNTPTRTPTATPTGTSTPVLLPLTTLILADDAVFAPGTIWRTPTTPIDLDELEGDICLVDCVGKLWDDQNFQDTLSLTMYRTVRFEDAQRLAFAASFIYLDEGYSPVPVPSGYILPAQTWIGERGDSEYVLVASQGPAILTFFWRQSTGNLTELDLVTLLVTYAEAQSAVLRENRFISIDPNATPLP